MTATQPDMPQIDGVDAPSDAEQTLAKVLKLIEQWSIVDDLTKADQKEYIKSLVALRADIKRFQRIVRASVAVDDLLYLMAAAVFRAHEIGTYKTPAQSSPERGIISALLTPRTKRPTAEYVSWLEMLDPNFRKQREKIKAKAMREKKAARDNDRQEAIMDAIKSVRGEGPSPHPDAEAGRILPLVNKRLEKANQPPVSKDVIYRRLKKYPRS